MHKKEHKERRMHIFKRIFLFLAINMIIVLTVSSLLSIFHLTPLIHSYGLNLSSLMLFCLIWGMTGSVISLFLSKTLAKMLLRVKVITENDNQQMLLSIVNRISQQAGLKKNPEIGIYSSNEVNAFATGATKNSSLIAVSSGLLNHMTYDEIEAIIGHEISHIVNGDMVTMTLLQGVVNAFVMFLARILAYAVSSSGRSKNQNISYGTFYLFTFIFEIIFMLFGSIIIAAFSRRRELKADLGSSQITSKQKMINALESLKNYTKIRDPMADKPALAFFKIHHNKKSLFSLFASHPSLEERIEKLQRMG